jgi:hypothetical protein
VSPPGFGVGAGAAPGRRGPGEGVWVGPVHGQRAAGVLELLRDGCLEQVIADGLQPAGGQPAGRVLAEGRAGQPGGALGLPVSQLVRVVLPVRDDTGPPLPALAERGERLVHPGQVRGPVIGVSQAHPGQQGADLQLPPAHAGGRMTSIRGATPETPVISSGTVRAIMATGLWALVCQRI